MEKTEKLEKERLERDVNNLLEGIQFCLSESEEAIKRSKKEIENSKKIADATLERLKTDLLEETIEIETTEFGALQKIVGQLKSANDHRQEIFLIFPERKPFNSGSYKISYIKSIKIVK